MDQWDEQASLFPYVCQRRAEHLAGGDFFLLVGTHSVEFGSRHWLKEDFLFSFANSHAASLVVLVVRYNYFAAFLNMAWQLPAFFPKSHVSVRRSTARSSALLSRARSSNTRRSPS